MRVIITIPIFSKLNKYEKLSLENLILKLDKYEKIFIKPISFDIEEYTKEFGISFINFPDKYFKSPQTYNNLLRSTLFFESFTKYDFLLMHHLDAYIFNDNLEYWLKKDFDYVGAPLYRYDGSFICVGNGGLSLHKVSSALKVLKTYKIIYPLKDLIIWYSKFNFFGKIRYLKYFFFTCVGLGRNSRSGLNNLKLNEDIFWGKYVPESFNWYKIAPFKQAYKFSIEFNYKELYLLNNRKLPFGTHQWYKKEFYDFWVNEIKAIEIKND